MSSEEAITAVPATATSPLLRVEALEKHFAVRRGLFGRQFGTLSAVNGVTFEVAYGETLGLVGESGSGKTTTGRLIARLEEPSAGRIFFDGEDWLALSGRRLRRRRRDLQMVFQDPQTSLNPRMRVGDQVAEPLRVQALARGEERRSRVAALLAAVGLPASAAWRLPAEFSGGERQRIAIARALATRPKFLVCDEPVSALDVSVAAQVTNLFLDLRDHMGLASLFISHDLAVVSRVAHRIAVMYLGRIVEQGPSDAVIGRPLHPYTAALLSAVPIAEPGSDRARILLPGDPPSGVDPPAGCPFHPRCPIARERCAVEAPALESIEPEHEAACHYPGELVVGSR